MKQLRIQIPEYNALHIYKYKSPLQGEETQKLDYKLNLSPVNYYDTPKAPLPKDNNDIEQFFSNNK